MEACLKAATDVMSEAESEGALRFETRQQFIDTFVDLCRNKYEETGDLIYIYALNDLVTVIGERDRTWLAKKFLSFVVDADSNDKLARFNNISSIKRQKTSRRHTAVLLARTAQGKGDSVNTVKYVTKTDADRQKRTTQTAVRNMKSFLEEEGIDLGSSWESAYVAAAAILKDTVAAGSPETMKRGYEEGRKPESPYDKAFPLEVHFAKMEVVADLSNTEDAEALAYAHQMFRDSGKVSLCEREVENEQE